MKSVQGSIGARFRVAAVAAAAMVLASCGPGRPPLPPPPAFVEVTMDEYRFKHEGPVPTGRVVFGLRNVGNVDHELVLVPLPEDLPPLRDQIRSDDRLALGTLAHPPPLTAGDAATFAVQITPGRYGLVCFLEDPDGIPHFRKGMHSELVVR